MRVYSVVAGILLGLGLCFGGAQAQEIEHLSLPSPSVTDRALPPAKDGGIYLPSGGGMSKAATSKTKTSKGKDAVSKKKKKTLKAKTKGERLKAKATKGGKKAKVAPSKKKAKTKAKKK